MHESSLTKQILDAALAAAPPLSRVTVPRGRVAETESLLRDSLSASKGRRIEVCAQNGDPLPYKPDNERGCRTTSLHWYA